MEKAKGNKKENEEKQMMRRKETERIYEDGGRGIGIIRPFILLLLRHSSHFPRCLLFLISTVIIYDTFIDILPAYAWRNLIKLFWSELA